jgi:outer membrane receptor protein involved in Fe transport
MNSRVLLLLVLLPLANSVAQSPVAIADPSRRTETLPISPSPISRAPLAASPEEASTQSYEIVPGSADSDLGEQRILRETPKPRPFRFSLDTMMYHSSNAAQLSAGEVDDWFFGSRLSLGWQRPLGKRFVFDIGATQDLFRYDELDILDFESLETSLSLLYALPWSRDFFLVGQYQYGRLTQEFDALAQSHSLRLGIQKSFSINRRNTINLAMIGDWDVDTDVDALKRHQYIGAATWTFKLIPKVNLLVGYNYIFYDYTEYERDDHLHNLGVSIVWSPLSWMDVYTSYNHSFNRSNIDAFDYQDATAGLGLGLRIRF